MRSNITYVAELPRHTFKRDWSNGMSVPLDEIFKLFKDKYGKGDVLTLDFVDWFKTTYIKNRDFVINIYKDEFNSQVESLAVSEEQVVALVKEEVWDDSDNKIVIESSEVEVASSLREAQSRLRKMRHPDEVGEIERDLNNIETNVTDAEKIKSLPKPGTMVITGDDFTKSGETSAKNAKKPARGLMLDKNGRVTDAIPTSKQEQERMNNRMSNISGKVRYLEEDQDGEGLVVFGDNLSTDSSESEPVEPKTKHNTETPLSKVNKNFKGFPSYDGKREILPDHIVNASSDKEAVRLVNLCSNSTTLRVAKIYLENIGNHKLIEHVEERLRNIPPGQ